MKKNLGTRTATTYTMDPALTALDPEDQADLTGPYTWKHEDAARDAIRMFREQETHGMYRVVRHEAPGLEVYAIYRYAHAYADSDELVLMSVVEFADDTAARLHKAVRREQPVTVTYVKADGEETVRTIEPTSLSTTRTGAVIVKALDRKSDEARSFRLDRIGAYTVHRTRRTVRTAPPAPSKAELWEAWQAHRREFVPARPAAPALA